MDTLAKITKQAQLASRFLKGAGTHHKNQALSAIAQAIDHSKTQILVANKIDLNRARQHQLSESLLDRLLLNDERINSITQSVLQVINLADPVGQITDLNYRPSGIQVGKMRTPLGVIAIIYESRPNVTTDAAALCLKSGNVAILRGGKDAMNSNMALYTCIQSGLKQAGINLHCVQLVQTTDHGLVKKMTAAVGFIDAVIPRGGKGLIEAVSHDAKVPVIKHLHGVCHTYIDKVADIDKAVAVALNAKTRRYGVCNATETLLVHQNIAQQVLPPLIKQYQQKGVELRGCDQTQKLDDGILAASETDWYSEYLAPILSIRIVSSINEAMSHIDQYGSGHTDSILTQDYTRAKLFLTQVDSSSVMVNASTGFADGFEYGLGAEIGISTDKIHVRGPVGLEGLTSQKYIVLGDGHIRP